jgi:hypothetical protein
MMFFSALLFLVFAPLLSFAQSQNGTDVLALAVKNLPPCAVCQPSQHTEIQN